MFDKRFKLKRKIDEKVSKIGFNVKQHTCSSVNSAESKAEIIVRHKIKPIERLNRDIIQEEISSVLISSASISITDGTESSDFQIL